jgi:glycosyltransferase involved in cell wall biosynthesis
MDLSVVHVVVTTKFAGVERYVANTATELVDRGCDVAVIGGSPDHMPAALGEAVKWLPGSTILQTLRSFATVGRCDICHAHMTLAETAAVLARPIHRAPIVATRHFAAPRGSTRISRPLGPLLTRSLAREIAASHFVAERLEKPPDAILPSGTRRLPNLWRPQNRVVLVIQRLQPEKDTLTALKAWEISRLWEEGWSLRLVGAGAERHRLEEWAATRGVPAVSFAGWVADVEVELAAAGMVVAPTPAEALGLGVLEAMAAGVPVVACASGGHLETVARLPGARLFPPHDAKAAAAGMRSLLPDRVRRDLSFAGRELVESKFSVTRHVDHLLEEYGVVAPRSPKRVTRRHRENNRLSCLVVCSLEPWDDVWRRNQFLVDNLLRRNPQLRVLFVEPPADPTYDVASRRRPAVPSLRTIGYEDRLKALKPLKPLPRRAGVLVDAALRAQVRVVARALGFVRPTLWINDVTYAPLIRVTGWPSVYDVTDDWLAAPFSKREVTRLAALDETALHDAGAVVVCSNDLATTRGALRAVNLIPNAVDVAHFRRRTSRPDDLPEGQVAVYVGSLHDSRLDTDLVIELARSLPELHVALVGPDSLTAESRRRLISETNVRLTGVRPYRDVPAYLQHADVIVIPHLVNEFTESLDPIKAYECLAAGTLTVATPIAGFRDAGGCINIAQRDSFVSAVTNLLGANVGGRESDRDNAIPSWEERTADFEQILSTVTSRGRLEGA